MVEYVRTRVQSLEILVALKKLGREADLKCWDRKHNQKELVG